MADLTNPGTPRAVRNCAQIVKKKDLLGPGLLAISGAKMTKYVSISRRFIELANRPGNCSKYNADGTFPNEYESASYPVRSVSKLAAIVGGVSRLRRDFVRNYGRAGIAHSVTVIIFPYLTRCVPAANKTHQSLARREPLTPAIAVSWEQM
jgi:hypothetical protein